MTKKQARSVLNGVLCDSFHPYFRSLSQGLFLRFLGLLLFLDLFLHGNTVVSMSGPVRSLAFETAVARLEIRKNKIFLTLEMIILTFLALAFLVSSAGFGPSSEMTYSPRIKFCSPSYSLHKYNSSCWTHPRGRTSRWSWRPSPDPLLCCPGSWYCPQESRWHRYQPQHCPLWPSSPRSELSESFSCSLHLGTS